MAGGRRECGGRREDMNGTHLVPLNGAEEEEAHEGIEDGEEAAKLAWRGGRRGGAGRRERA